MITARALAHKQGWRRAKLGDAAEFIMGQAPPGNASNFEGKGTVFVKAGEFGAAHPIIREWTTKPLRFARSGDVLICVVGATAGKLNLAIDCAIGRSVAAIRPSEDILDRFLYLQLQPKVHDLRAASMGSAQGVINKQMLGNIDVVIPSIDEQREIVAEIEKQFTLLEAGVAGLRRVQANLKRYRAAVLKAACEGKLVPTEAELARQRAEEKVAAASRRWSSGQEQRRDASATLSVSGETAGEGENQSRDGSATLEESYETGAQLLERILTDRRKEWSGKGKFKEPEKPETESLPELPKGWEWATVDQLASPDRNSITDGPFGSNLKTQHYTESGPRVIRLQNIGDSRFVDEYAHISNEHFVRLQKHRVFADDIVIAGLGENPPRSCLIPETVGPAIVKADCIRYKPHTSVSVRYINFMLNAEPTRKRTKSIVHGVGRPRLNLGEIKSIVVPLPPLAEQQRIVAEVERRLSVVEELEAVVNANLQRATRLRQSILQRAFEGKLVQSDSSKVAAASRR